MAVSGAKFGRLVYTVTVAAALTVLLSAPLPAPAQSPTDLYLATDSGTPLIIRDLSDGSDQAHVYASGAVNLRLFGQTSRNRIEIATTDGATLIVGGSGGAAGSRFEGGPLSLDSGLTVGGALNVPRRTTNSSAALTDADAVLLANKGLGALTVTLPAAAGRDGRVYYVWRTDATAGTISLAAAGSETINGVASVTLTAGQIAFVVQIGSTAWLAKIW